MTIQDILLLSAIALVVLAGFSAGVLYGMHSVMSECDKATDTGVAVLMKGRHVHIVSKMRYFEMHNAEQHIMRSWRTKV